MAETKLSCLIGQFIIVQTLNSRQYIGCLLKCCCSFIIVRIWNGSNFLFLRVPFKRINDIIPFPCCGKNKRFVVLQLNDGSSLVGCQTITNNTVTVITVFNEQNKFETITLNNDLISSILAFPCTEDAASMKKLYVKKPVQKTEKITAPQKAVSGGNNIFLVVNPPPSQQKVSKQVQDRKAVTEDYTDEKSTIETYLQLGQQYMTQHNWKEAEFLFLNAFMMADNSKLRIKLISSLLQLGDLHNETRNKEKASVCLQLAKKLAVEGNYQALELIIQDQIAGINDW